MVSFSPGAKFRRAAYEVNPSLIYFFRPVGSRIPQICTLDPVCFVRSTLIRILLSYFSGLDLMFDVDIRICILRMSSKKLRDEMCWPIARIIHVRNRWKCDVCTVDMRKVDGASASHCERKLVSGQVYPSSPILS